MREITWNVYYGTYRKDEVLNVQITSRGRIIDVEIYIRECVYRFYNQLGLKRKVWITGRQKGQSHLSMGEKFGESSFKSLIRK